MSLIHIQTKFVPSSMNKLDSGSTKYPMLYLQLSGKIPKEKVISRLLDSRAKYQQVLKLVLRKIQPLFDRWTISPFIILNYYRLIDDYAKDGGEELFTKMHCVLTANP